MLFAKPTRSVGVDIGTHSVKAVQLSRVGGRARVDNVGYAIIDASQANVDPIEAQADAVREALRYMPTGNSIFVGALPGQTVVIRYPRLPDMSDDELQRAIDQEASQNLPFELSEVFVDWTVLDRDTEGDEAIARVLLVAAKHELIDTRVQVADAAEIQYAILGVDSLALADAAESCDFLRVGETVALVNIGASSTTIHFVKDGISNFYRDVNWGAREMIQAIVKSRRCDPPVAEQMLRDSGAASPPSGAGPPPLPEGEPAQPPLADLDEGEPTEGLSDLEDLSGGSALDPLQEELGGPGEQPPSRTSIGAGAGPEQPLDEILQAPLSRLVTEIRRSFDYYEQQLYEHPVDRLLLSGGVAHLPLVGDTLRDELGLEGIEVCDPTASALLLGQESAISPLLQQPARFMVAVGLAARGIAEL